MGKNFTQVGEKQQRRYLTQIQLVVSFVFIKTNNFATMGKLAGCLVCVFERQKAQDALWFAETYGLLPESLMLRDTTGQVHEVKVTKERGGKLEIKHLKTTCMQYT